MEKTTHPSSFISEGRTDRSSTVTPWNVLRPGPRSSLLDSWYVGICCGTLAAGGGAGRSAAVDEGSLQEAIGVGVFIANIFEGAAASVFTAGSTVGVGG